MDALPPRARLLHVGLMKTGTTALQTAASDRRRSLLRHGVRYPGWHYNHRNAAQALFERTADHRRLEPDDWDRLMSQVRADQLRRILISNELLAVADEPVIRTMREDLGPLTHVIFTVRSFASILPSLWQQYVKSGHRRDFDEFLSRRLAGDDVESTRDLARHDQAALISRWAGIFGPENVTVIVVDKSEPQRVSSAFEQLLDLPEGLLYEPDLKGQSVNRSLSVHEASLVLAVNRVLAGYGLSRTETEPLVKGAIARMLDECPAPTGDAQLVLPPWAVEPAVARSREHADAIAGLGVRVVGDLAELSKPPRTAPGPWETSTAVPIEVAAQAVAGAVSAALYHGSNFGLPAGARPGTLAAVQGQARWVSNMGRQFLGQLRGRIRSGLRNAARKRSGR